MTSVSVIIRTYNEEKSIRACLQRVFSQKFDGDFEVIIVDSYSTDKTIQIARQFDTKIFYLPFSSGRSINYGINKSTGGHVIILSAHAIPVDDNWMSNLTRNFDDQKVAGIYGRQIPRPDCNPMDARDLASLFGGERKIQTGDPFFSNANSAIRRAIWNQIPFDDRAKATEDRLWAQRVLDRGYVIVYEPSAAVMHSHNETLRQAYRRRLREVRQGCKVGPMTKGKLQLKASILSLSHRVFLDWAFIIKKRYSAKWLLIGPLRRFVQGWAWYIGSHKGSRAIRTWFRI